MRQVATTCQNSQILSCANEKAGPYGPANLAKDIAKAAGMKNPEQIKPDPGIIQRAKDFWDEKGSSSSISEPERFGIAVLSTMLDPMLQAEKSIEKLPEAFSLAEQITKTGKDKLIVERLAKNLFGAAMAFGATREAVGDATLASLEFSPVLGSGTKVAKTAGQAIMTAATKASSEVSVYLATRKSTYALARAEAQELGIPIGLTEPMRGQAGHTQAIGMLAPRQVTNKYLNSLPLARIATNPAQKANTVRGIDTVSISSEALGRQTNQATQKLSHIEKTQLESKLLSQPTLRETNPYTRGSNKEYPNNRYDGYEVSYLDPTSLRFSQNSTNYNTSHLIATFQNSPGSKAKHYWDFDKRPIVAVKMESGELVSFDNRRLFAAKATSKDEIPVILVNEKDACIGTARSYFPAIMDAENWGEAIRKLRWLDKSEFPNGYPLNYIPEVRMATFKAPTSFSAAIESVVAEHPKVLAVEYMLGLEKPTVNIVFTPPFSDDAFRSLEKVFGEGKEAEAFRMYINN